MEEFVRCYTEALTNAHTFDEVATIYERTLLLFKDATNNGNSKQMLDLLKMLMNERNKLIRDELSQIQLIAHKSLNYMRFNKSIDKVPAFKLDVNVEQPLKQEVKAEEEQQQQNVSELASGQNVDAEKEEEGQSMTSSAMMAIEKPSFPNTTYEITSSDEEEIVNEEIKESANKQVQVISSPSSSSSSSSSVSSESTEGEEEDEEGEEDEETGDDDEVKVVYGQPEIRSTYSKAPINKANRPFMEAEDAYLKVLWAKGWTVKQIKEEYNKMFSYKRAYSSLRQRLRLLNILPTVNSRKRARHSV
jgi:hypothetical protein